ncbi:uncharacterized protein LOC143574773 [Bidens hawaiensis]|uniref:uncharacterized protein LOC143574773 n=1 Tax=Bidens hawaiensis TaxID=980011 RepID=UPI00404B9FAD
MRQRRWLELLKDYDANIQYHPGKANVLADALSRKSFVTVSCLQIHPRIIYDLDRLGVGIQVGDSNGYLARMQIEPGLISRIKDAQRLCVQDDYALRELLLAEAHSSPFSINLGSTKMYRDLRQNFWWSGMKEDVARYIDGQSERTIHTLEDMLRACELEWTGNWDEYLCLVEFAYNNFWQASVGMAPFELLYGRKCQAPTCWEEIGEKIIEGPELVQITNEKVTIAREKLKEAQSRQKSYADQHRRALEFQVGDHVFLKVSPCRGVRRFGIKGKLSPRYIGPFEILERIGEVSYRLALPPQLSHVHNVFHVSLLRGYNYHLLQIISYPLHRIHEDLSYVEEPEAILDRQERVMRRKVIPFVKVLWKNHSEREATWETEESVRSAYPNIFE